MKFITQSPKKALTAFIKQRPPESERDKFKTNLIALLDKISVIEKQPNDESEEHLKNNIRDFLRDTFYINSNAINTKDKKDLVIHIGKSTDTDVAVIIEAKRPSNVKEMISVDNANKKALHELILYYLNERNQSNNIQIKQLVITNIYEWFIIDANEFDKLIYRNTQIKKLYETKLNDKKDNPWFYEEISKIVSNIEDEIHCVHFNIRDYDKILRNNITEDDKELVALYKILSPQHLLKIATPNDSNSLNEKFYKELLHIIGLEEVKEGTKNVIRRKKENRNAASLIELAIEALKTEDTFHRIPDIKVYGENKEEQTFNIALELCITWINRILFLKLLEGQLITYHAPSLSGKAWDGADYRFLNSETIHDYDELFKLFHKVLAVNIPDRTEANKTKYSRVPYLNSSLFEISELEDQTIKINSLENDGELELINTTILKELKKKADKLPSLNYLFNFLDAYDFSSEGTEDWQKDNKQLINASVLGKVFEKINGYKDGSVFTPAFITMYMCRQSIRSAVVEKFNCLNHNLQDSNTSRINKYKSIEDVYEAVGKDFDRKKANEIINSLKICDPAVGSGHFLVSALNEIIAIKSELGILMDKNGKTLRDFKVEVIDDELYVYDIETFDQIKYIVPGNKTITTTYNFSGDSFETNNKTNSEKQRVFETLFHEKQTIIENCLFGVDINPNSVKICRLRLWIELLKNAYYKAETNYTELETLPNIDINIKCGNSLLSRFAINTDLKQIAKSSKWNIFSYQNAVKSYKNSSDKEAKRELEKFIQNIRSNYLQTIQQRNPKLQKYYKLKQEYDYKFPENGLFAHEPETNYGENFEKREKEKQRLAIEIEKIFAEIEAEKSFYSKYNAFEWRFEFPEVLNENGDFIGFDLIIGNPPYGVSLKDSLRETIVSKLSKVPDYEIYYFFINLSKFLLKSNGINTFIIPNTILFNVFAKNYRENLFQNWQIQEILDCTDLNVFESSATVRCIITQFINKKSDDVIYYRPTANVTSFEDLKTRPLNKTSKEILLKNNQNWALVFKLNSDVLQLVSKIKYNKNTLEGFFPEFSQGLIAYDKYQGQDELTIKNRIYHSNQKQAGWKKWIWGEDITPYSVKWNGKEFINYCNGIANPREPKYFKGERILVREITNPKIFAGYTNEEYYNDPAIINIIKNKKGYFELKTLLAILNSKLATFYHFNSSPKATKGAFPKILVEDLKNFPLPEIEEKKQNKLIILVDKIISLKQQGKDSSEQEKKIDEMVYKLYDITTEEQKIIDGK